MKPLDLSGQKIGRWAVGEPSTITEKYRTGATVRRRVWMCRCECGTVHVLRTETLRKGQRSAPGGSRSCGCLRNELTKARYLMAPGIAAINDALRSYKKGARERRRSWSISDEEALRLFSSNCVYCGAQPDKIMHRPSGDFWYTGIDRIDNSLGYVPGNVVPCCTMCNKAKHGWPVEVFRAWALRLARHQLGLGVAPPLAQTAAGAATAFALTGR